jgi:hypothetical protein
MASKLNSTVVWRGAAELKAAIQYIWQEIAKVVNNPDGGDSTASAVTFQLRRALAADWTANNPVLSEGEPGFETDTGKLKIGNGTDDWTTLPYV